MAMRRDPDPFALFLNATCFWRASAALVGHSVPIYPHSLPQFIVEAFALELHLKSLLRVRGKLLTDTHEPRHLYDALDEADQLLVVEKTRLLPSDPITIDINAVLKRSAGVFKNLRYHHEGHEWPKDDKGIAGNAGFYEVIRATRLIILDAEPSWKAKYTSILGTQGSNDEIPETLNAKSILHMQLISPSTGT